MSLFILCLCEKNDFCFLHETIHAKSLSLVKENRCRDKTIIFINNQKEPVKANLSSIILIIVLFTIIVYMYKQNKKLAKENKELANQLLNNEHLNIDKKEEAPIEVSEEHEEVEKTFHPINQISEDKPNKSPTIINTEIPVFDHETMEMIEMVMNETKLYLSQDLNVKQLASAMGVTQKKLLATFKQHPQSISFNDYVNQKRVNHACILLKEHPEYTVEAIAADSGFSSPITFYRWFEKITGMKPKEYRKANELKIEN